MVSLQGHALRLASLQVCSQGTQTELLASLQACAQRDRKPPAEVAVCLSSLGLVPLRLSEWLRHWGSCLRRQPSVKQRFINAPLSPAALSPAAVITTLKAYAAGVERAPAPSGGSPCAAGVECQAYAIARQVHDAQAFFMCTRLSSQCVRGRPRPTPTCGLGCDRMS